MSKKIKLPTFGGGDRRKSTGNCRSDRQRAAASRRKKITSKRK